MASLHPKAHDTFSLQDSAWFTETYHLQTAFHQTVSPVVLLLNRQIYSEGVGFLYSQPLFFSSTSFLGIFLEKIGTDHTALLQDITIGTWAVDNTVDWYLLLRNATGLKRLTMQAYASSKDVVKDLLRQSGFFSCFEGLIKNLKIMVGATGKVQITKSPFEGCYALVSMTFQKA